LLAWTASSAVMPITHALGPHLLPVSACWCRFELVFPATNSLSSCCPIADARDVRIQSAVGFYAEQLTFKEADVPRGIPVKKSRCAE
jgi:hypothetical protein